MLKEVLEHIVKKLVNQPELVSITTRHEEGKDILEIAVGERDIGRVIGKNGQTIKALRMLLASIAPEGKEVIIQVLK